MKGTWLAMRHWFLEDILGRLWFDLTLRAFISGEGPGLGCRALEIHVFLGLRFARPFRVEGFGMFWGFLCPSRGQCSNPAGLRIVVSWWGKVGFVVIKPKPSVP